MLIKLMLGVRQFQDEPYKQMQSVFKSLSVGQKPEILFITCADSRLMPSLLTQTKPGELFVIRNVGNIIPPATVPSSEAAGLVFALNELPSIKDIIICGHSHCGAMKGLLAPNLKERLPEVSSWLAHSYSVLKKIPPSSDYTLKLQEATKLNIVTQLEHLKTYPIIAEKIAKQELTLHGWLYEFEKGEVQVYQAPSQEFVPFKAALDLAVFARRDKIIEQVTMHHLEPLTSPQTAKDYTTLMHLLSQLEANLLPIWSLIKEKVYHSLWNELGGLYADAKSLQFTQLVEQGCHLKLPNLKNVQQKIKESPGYLLYSTQNLRGSIFAVDKKNKHSDQKSECTIRSLL